MPTIWSDDILIADLADEPALSDELNEVIEQTENPPEGRGGHVVLNFGDVSYINSSNIAQLLRLRKDLTARGKRLQVCNMSDEVWTVMLTTGLDKVLSFSPDTMTALASLQLEDESV
jgi:anti-anti-sigma factor